MRRSSATYPRTSMRTGAITSSTYEIVGPYTDENGVAWVIRDNGCGVAKALLGLCSTQERWNQFLATQHEARYPKMSGPLGPTDVRFTAIGESDVKLLVDAYARKNTPIATSSGKGTGDVGLGGITTDATTPAANAVTDDGAPVLVTAAPAPSSSPHKLSIWYAAPPALGLLVAGPIGAVVGVAVSAVTYAARR